LNQKYFASMGTLQTTSLPLVMVMERIEVPRSQTMKKAILVVVLVSSLTLPSRIANADEKDTIQQLLAENQNLTLQLDNAKKVQGDIAKAGLAINGADSALKYAQEELRREGTGLLQEGQQIQNAAQATGCPWGTRQSDIAYVDSCNAEGKRLMAMWEELQKQGASLEVYARELDKERSELTKRTMEWAAKKKANDADLGDLDAARTAWLERYSAFVMHSEAYERLKVQAPAAQICKVIANLSGDSAVNLGDLEAAAACLNRLWDGAR
jgi:peptidoglycan hydrolase CwlO-like protein